MCPKTTHVYKQKDKNNTLVTQLKECLNHTLSKHTTTNNNNNNLTNKNKQRRRKEGNVLFNYALNTFYLRLYCVGHMVKDHSDSERGNPLPPHGLFFPINSKGSFVCIIP